MAMPKAQKAYRSPTERLAELSKANRLLKAQIVSLLIEISELREQVRGLDTPHLFERQTKMSPTID